MTTKDEAGEPEAVWADAAELARAVANAAFLIGICECSDRPYHGIDHARGDPDWQPCQDALRAIRTGNPTAIKAALANLKETGNG